MIGALLALVLGGAGPTLPDSLRAAMHTVRPAPTFDAWAVPIPKDEADASTSPRATVYRWWTDSCPWCAQSLPALEQLRKRAEPAGVRMIAVYHPKPPREVTKEAADEMAKKLGYKGEVVLDLDWATLKKAYLDSGNRRATSVTILVDDKGIVRFVHPGPVFFDSDEAKFKDQDRDHAKLEKAIRALLR